MYQDYRGISLFWPKIERFEYKHHFTNTKFLIFDNDITLHFICAYKPIENVWSCYGEKKRFKKRFGLSRSGNCNVRMCNVAD